MGGTKSCTAPHKILQLLTFFAHFPRVRGVGHRREYHFSIGKKPELSMTRLYPRRRQRCRLHLALRCSDGTRIQDAGTPGRGRREGWLSLVWTGLIAEDGNEGGSPVSFLLAASHTPPTRPPYEHLKSECTLVALVSLAGEERKPKRRREESGRSLACPSHLRSKSKEVPYSYSTGQDRTVPRTKKFQLNARARQSGPRVPYSTSRIRMREHAERCLHKTPSPRASYRAVLYNVLSRAALVTWPALSSILTPLACRWRGGAAGRR
jgi:hypothetical protein